MSGKPRIVDGPINPANGLPRKWHRSIVKMGADNWFTGPPHLWSQQAVRGDSQNLFNQLAVSLNNTELLEKRNQIIETYSHWMAQVENALEEEAHLTVKMRVVKTSEEEIRARWHQIAHEKNRMRALKEMDRLGPVICLITQHLNAVTAGDANPIEDEVSQIL